VVYYAGHGMEIGGVNCLIPVDARLKADSDAETQAVALEQVIAAVAGAKKLRLVMLDACRDNPFEKIMQRTIALKLVNRGFSNIEPEAGFMVVYAAKHGEAALDGDAKNSPFATVSKALQCLDLVAARDRRFKRGLTVSLKALRKRCFIHELVWLGV
jgi:uncharacterized caspase-like protein